MNHNEGSFYDQLKSLLLRYPTLRWISKENDSVLASEKIEAVNLSYFEVLSRFPRYILLDSQNADSMTVRFKLNQAKKYAGNVLSWQKLFMLFNDQYPLLLLREKREIAGYYTLYILVRHGMRFMGAKTIVIDHEAKN
jgi:hypothetical protein